MNTAWRILDLARWAPSGDNSQPWRFEMLDEDRVVVHAFDTRRHCLYDPDGQASQLSVGALLETIRIAASLHGRTASISRRRDAPDEFPVFDIRFVPVPGLTVDPLHTAIRDRAVQRRPLSTRALSAPAKVALEQAAGHAYQVVWFETAADRGRLAWLALRSAKIRLTIPEAYEVHRNVIAWGKRFSEDRIPDQALGACALSLRSMRWALASWQRVRRMNRYFGGTLTPRLELDLWPGLRCGAHFALIAARPPQGIDDHLAAGAAMQRFWLTATQQGLQMQPQYTPLVFSAYARRGLAFTEERAALVRAEQVQEALAGLLATHDPTAAVFLGRIGYGRVARSRSLRLPLERLQWASSQER